MHVVITRPFLSAGLYDRGEVYEVTKTGHGGVYITIPTVKREVFIGNDEYKMVERGELIGLSKHLCETTAVGSLQRIV